MKTLLAALAILLSSHLAAQDDQFKIKGFYAGMPLEEFQAVAESHGALMTNEDRNYHSAYFMHCEETLVESKRQTSPHQNSEGDKARKPTDFWFCNKYASKPSRITLGGFDVYYVTLDPPNKPEAGDFTRTLSFKLPLANKEKVFKRLSKRFGEPTWEFSDANSAVWRLGMNGDFEYDIRMDSYGGVWVAVDLWKGNPSAEERYKQAKELEAENDF